MRPQFSPRALLPLLLTTSAAAAGGVYGINAADNRLHSVLDNTNVTDTLPFNGTSSGRGIVSSCFDGKRLFTFASGVGSSAVVLAGISVNGSGSVATFTTPFTELSNVFMMGMYPSVEPEGSGCQFFVVGRISPTSDWQLCNAGIQEGRSDAIVMAAEGGRVNGSYARDLEGPSTFDVAGSTVYYSVSHAEDVNGTQENRTWAVAVDFSAPGPARVGFCQQNSSHNLATMDFDTRARTLVGMGTTATGSDGGGSARVMMRLKMAPAAQAAPNGVAADPFNSPAAICEWRAGPPTQYYPSAIGGLSALINASATARVLGAPWAARLQQQQQQQLLVWLGRPRMSSTQTDAVACYAGTGEFAFIVAGVCTDPAQRPRGLCYTVMGAE